MILCLSTSLQSNPSFLLKESFSSNSCWYQEDLPIRGLHTTEVLVHGKLGVQEEEFLDKIKTTSCKGLQEKEEEEELNFRDSFSQFSQFDYNTLLASLAACAKRKDIHTGSRIHVEIVTKGIDTENVYIGNTLINLYAKCGALEKAQEVFDGLLVRNIISWNTLISGYAQHGQGEEALRYFEAMKQGGFTPNAITLASVLKVCSSVDKLQELHAWIGKNDMLQTDIFVGTAVIDAYAKCGLLAKAREVFDDLQERDVVLWTTLIMGYALHGCGEEALNCFLQMQHEGLSPNAITFAGIFKACGNIGALQQGQELHARVSKEYMETHALVMNSVLDMYIKCGTLEKAQEVFHELPLRDGITWTTLITGQVHQGHHEEAIVYFGQMLRAGYPPSSATFSAILKACGNIGDVNKGQEVHARAIGVGSVNDSHVGTAIIVMYADCSMLCKAKAVFDEFQVRDAVMWNAIISGYAQHEYDEEALNCFELMQLQGFVADTVTYTSMLMVHSRKRDLFKGQELHADIMKFGNLEEDTIVNTGLVDMYAHCGMLAEAQQVFDSLPKHDVIAWNVLIRGYSQHKHDEEALYYLDKMKLRGLSPNAPTFVWALKACGNMESLDKGLELHADIAREELTDVSVNTTLVDMYMKFGLLEEAQEVFEELQEQDVVLWNALIAGYTEHGYEDKALRCFEHMQREGVSPDAVSFACILKSCSSIGAAYRGQQLHVACVNAGWPEEDMAVGTALVDMYANSGMLPEAQDVFEKLPARDVVSWNALLAGYAQLGDEQFVFTIFNEMLQEGEMPTVITFIILLKLCSHRGLLDTGQGYFRMSIEVYGILPTLEHHICMVDLFSRAGHLHKGVTVIAEMSFLSDVTSWHTVLNACQTCGDAKLGSWAFKHTTLADRKNAAAHVCLSNIYSAA